MCNLVFYILYIDSDEKYIVTEKFLRPLHYFRVFERLDQADGNADGLIDRKAFLKWLHALDLQKTIEFEANLGITPRELEKLITAADRNRDGFVDRSEFIRLVSNRDKQLSK